MLVNPYYVYLVDNNLSTKDSLYQGVISRNDFEEYVKKTICKILTRIPKDKQNGLNLIDEQGKCKSPDFYNGDDSCIMPSLACFKHICDLYKVKQKGIKQL